MTNNMLKQLTNKTILNITLIFKAMLKLFNVHTLQKLSTTIIMLKPCKLKNITSFYHLINLLPNLRKITPKTSFKKTSSISLKLTKLSSILNLDSKPTILQLTLSPSSLKHKKKFSDIFLNVTQVFNNVLQNRLLHNLKTNFLTPYFLIQKFYIDQHSFQININNSLSNQFKINESPKVVTCLLSFIYTSDIPKSSFTTLNIFTDDTSFLTSDTDSTIASFELQHHLNILKNQFIK